MLGDWFRPLELPIAFSEFKRLPRNPAYKYEYFGGRAVLTPRPRYQRAILDLNASSSPPWESRLFAEANPRRLQPSDWTCLPELLAAAFRSVPPLVTLEADVRLTVAQECVEHTRSGGDGPVVDAACFAAVDTRDAGAVVGAIIVTLVAERGRAPDDIARPHLTWVLVHPWRFGQGLGTALLARAVTALRGLGYRDLTSTFLVGNERSALWHWRNGFRLVPDALQSFPLFRRACPERSEGERGTGGEDAKGERA